MRKLAVNPRKRDIRWRYIYNDGKPEKFGAWNTSGDKFTSPQFTTTTNLERVVIEGRDIVTNETKPIAECDGQDFCLLKYRVAARLAANPMVKQPLMPTKSRIIGIVLVTRDYECEVLDNGEPPTLTIRSEWDKNQNYIAYGK